MPYSKRVGHKAPTPRQVQYLLAKVQHGLANKQVARRYRVNEQTIKNQFTCLRGRIGARTTTHAVYLLWSVLEPMLEAVSKPQCNKQSSAGIVESPPHRR